MVDSRKNRKCNTDRPTMTILPMDKLFDHKRKLRGKISKKENIISVRNAVMELICIDLGIRVNELNVSQIYQAKG